MRLRTTLACAGALALAAGAPAFAGDLAPPPLPAIPVPVPQQNCCGSEPGWYLRGDVGASLNEVGHHKITANPALNDTTLRGYNDDLTASTLVSVGVGYAVNSWLRFDATAEYRGGGKLSSVDVYSYNPPGGGALNGKDFYGANISSFVGMVNAYIDLGTWWCITPYIGGGVGVADNSISGFTDQGFNQNAASGTFYRSKSTDNFAWALMAGVAYDIAPNLKLDLGYRFLDAGRVQTGSSIDFAGTGQTYKYTQKDLYSSDFRIGLRWVLADKGPAPVYNQPLIRKY